MELIIERFLKVKCFAKNIALKGYFHIPFTFYYVKDIFFKSAIYN